MFWIVSGSSSVGKSSFIESRSSSEITGLPANTKVLFPQDQGKNELVAATCYFHYNIFRCVDLLHGDLIRQQSPRITELAQPAYEDDPGWRAIVNRPGEKSAVVLVATRQTLLQRIRQRTVVEPTPLRSGMELRYPSQYWEYLVGHVNLRQFYLAWLSELTSRHIPYLLVDSSNHNYRSITRREADELLSDSEPNYTKPQREKLLREE